MKRTGGFAVVLRTDDNGKYEGLDQGLVMEGLRLHGIV